MGLKKYLIFLIPVLLIFSSFPIYSAASILPQDYGKTFSEFNHRLIGMFILVLGIMAALGNSGEKKFDIFGKLWPFLFVLSGLYLAFMSDPNVWPLGKLGWIEVARTDPESLQHKIYALLLIALGAVEFQRSRGKLDKYVAVWGFPLLAVLGGFLLFFHKHSVGMAGMEMGQSMPDMNHTMLHIKREHLLFSILGFAVAAAKFFYDAGFWRKALRFLWPAGISLLGVFLLLYTE